MDQLLISALRVWAQELGDGTKEIDLWNEVCQAFKDGRFDDTKRPYFLLIDHVSGRAVAAKGRDVWADLRTLGNVLYVSKETMEDLARYSKRLPISGGSERPKMQSNPAHRRHSCDQRRRR